MVPLCSREFDENSLIRTRRRVEPANLKPENLTFYTHEKTTIDKNRARPPGPAFPIFQDSGRTPSLAPKTSPITTRQDPLPELPYSRKRGRALNSVVTTNQIKCINLQRFFCEDTNQILPKFKNSIIKSKIQKILSQITHFFEL